MGYLRSSRPLLATIVLVALTSMGCGYVMAGEWDDDARNWERAFGGSPPPNWKVMRSRVWRSPHFTYEGGYYFHVKLSSRAELKLLHSDYVRLQPEDPRDPQPCRPAPAWFAPLGVNLYEVRVVGDDNARILIDKKGRDVFLADCQY